MSDEETSKLATRSLYELGKESYGYLLDSLDNPDLDTLLAAVFLPRFREEEKFSNYIKCAEIEVTKRQKLTESDLAIFGILSYLHPDAMNQYREIFHTSLSQIKGKKATRADISFTKSLKLVLGIATGVFQLLRDDSKSVEWSLNTLGSFQKTSSPRDQIICGYFLLKFMNSQRTSKIKEEVIKKFVLANQGNLTTQDQLALLWFLNEIEYAGKYKDDVKKRESELFPQIFRFDKSRFNVLDYSLLCGVVDTYIDRFTNLTRELQKADLENKHKYLLNVLESFHISVRKLQDRRKGKNPLQIEDEYDVQDILYVILKPVFSDLQPEEPTPKDAGSSTIIDLVSKSTNKIIEIKYVDSTTKFKQVVKELKVDIESYYNHPNCGSLYLFIYDPTHVCNDPENIARDLSADREKGGVKFTVYAVINPC